MASAVAELGQALQAVVGDQEGSTERELLMAVSRCLCTVLHAAKAGAVREYARSSLALRLTCAFDGCLRQCCERDIANEVGALAASRG